MAGGADSTVGCVEGDSRGGPRTPHHARREPETGGRDLIEPPSHQGTSQTARALERATIARTYAIALVFGVAVEGAAMAVGLYRYRASWFVLVAIGAMFVGVLGTIALLTADRHWTIGFSLGAAAGIGAELANLIWLDMWTFDGLSHLGGPFAHRFAPLAVGALAGLVPPLIQRTELAARRISERHGRFT